MRRLVSHLRTWNARWTPFLLLTPAACQVAHDGPGSESSMGLNVAGFGLVSFSVRNVKAYPESSADELSSFLALTPDHRSLHVVLDVDENIGDYDIALRDHPEPDLYVAGAPLGKGSFMRGSVSFSLTAESVRALPKGNLDLEIRVADKVIGHVSDALFVPAPGDANLDNQFDSSDLTQLFQGGAYETGQPATWTTGDFDGDGLFTSSDLVLANQSGSYESHHPGLDPPAIQGVLRAGRATRWECWLAAYKMTNTLYAPPPDNLLKAGDYLNLEVNNTCSEAPVGPSPGPLSLVDPWTWDLKNSMSFWDEYPGEFVTAKCAFDQSPLDCKTDFWGEPLVVGHDDMGKPIYDDNCVSQQLKKLEGEGYQAGSATATARAQAAMDLRLYCEPSYEKDKPPADCVYDLSVRAEGTISAQASARKMSEGEWDPTTWERYVTSESESEVKISIPDLNENLETFSGERRWLTGAARAQAGVGCEQPFSAEDLECKFGGKVTPGKLEPYVDCYLKVTLATAKKLVACASSQADDPVAAEFSIGDAQGSSVSDAGSLHVNAKTTRSLITDLGRVAIDLRQTATGNAQIDDNVTPRMIVATGAHVGVPRNIGVSFQFSVSEGPVEAETTGGSGACQARAQLFVPPEKSADPSLPKVNSRPITSVGSAASLGLPSTLYQVARKALTVTLWEPAGQTPQQPVSHTARAWPALRPPEWLPAFPIVGPKPDNIQ